MNQLCWPAAALLIPLMNTAPISPADDVPGEARPGIDCAMMLVPGEIEIQSARAAADALDAPREAARTTTFVPLTYHVVRTSSGSGGLSAARMCQSLDDLDIAFADAGIRFYLAGPIDYIDSDFFYYEIDTIEEINMLRSTNVVAGTINVYFTANLPTCGISSFTTSPVQGIVMHNNCTGVSWNPSTFPHEVGHYFDLYHTHETAFGIECTSGSNCATAGDLLCDTPADPNLYTYPVTPECLFTQPVPPPCPGDPPYDPDTGNMMSGSLPACRDHFTPDQNARGLNVLCLLRPELVHSSLPGPEDCNGNGVRDDCDIASGTSLDLNGNGVPDECEDCPADVNGDLAVNVLDLLAVLAAWGAASGPEDVNGDGVVNVLDLLELLSQWGPCG